MQKKEPKALQGTLRRRSSLGLLRNKTKTWCFLQGSTLYMQKDSGAMDSLDMSLAEFARALATDKTGTHFEISIKKKKEVFACATKEECTIWLKALGKAMTIKSNGHESIFHEEYVFDDNSASIYNDPSDENSVDEAHVLEAGNVPVRSISEDSEPGSPIVDGNDILEEKSDLKNSSFNRSKSEVSTHSEYSPAASEASEENDCSDPYAEVKKTGDNKKKEGSTGSPMEAAKSQSGSSPRLSTKADAHSGRVSSSGRASIVPSRAAPPPPSPTLRVTRASSSSPSPSASSDVSVGNDAVIPDDDNDNNDDMDLPDFLEMLRNSLNDDGDSIPELSHVLSEEDELPLKNLMEFFCKNPQHWHRPTSRSGTMSDSDPFAKLQAQLDQLNLSSF